MQLQSLLNKTYDTNNYQLVQIIFNLILQVEFRRKFQLYKLHKQKTNEIKFDGNLFITSVRLYIMVIISSYFML